MRPQGTIKHFQETSLEYHSYSLNIRNVTEMLSTNFIGPLRIKNDLGVSYSG